MPIYLLMFEHSALRANSSSFLYINCLLPQTHKHLQIYENVYVGVYNSISTSEQ